MTRTGWRCIAVMGASLCACAHAPDHFYLLDPAPTAAPSAPLSPAVPVRISVSLPSAVDRPEMVVNTSPYAMSILDHERWGAPLSDQVAAAIARGIEMRRADLLVGDGRLSPASAHPIVVKVDIVSMTVEPAGRARIDARWRIADAAAPGATAPDTLGGDSFTAPVADATYGAIARAYADALHLLAEKLASEIPRR